MDEEKIKEEERYDGKWVLTTNTNLAASEVAIKSGAAVAQAIGGAIGKQSVEVGVG